MGKANRRKAKSKSTRTDPTGISAAVEDQLNGNPPEEEILPVIEKLGSPDHTERAWAAAGAANLVMADTATRKLLLSKGLLAKLVERLTDPQLEVVMEVTGCLRNLAAIDQDICIELHNKDALTPLQALVPRISSIIDKVLTGTPVTEDTDGDIRKTIWEFADNVISIFWSMSETSDKILRSINKLSIVSFLFSFLSELVRVPPKVAITAAQALHTLTDDNKDAYAEFQGHPEYTQLLIGLISTDTGPERLLVRVLACGILMNIRQITGPTGNWEDTEDDQANNEVTKLVLPVLTSSLNYDLNRAAEEALNAANIVESRKEEMEIRQAKPNQPLTEEERTLETIETRLRTLHLSLELLANICVQDGSEDDGWEDADDEMETIDDVDNDVTESVNDRQEDDISYLTDSAMLSEGTTNASLEQAVTKLNPVLNHFTTIIFPILIRLATATPLSFPNQQIPTPQILAPNITKALGLTHLRALECLNNFLLVMNDVPGKWWFKEHASEAVECWRWLFQVAHTAAGSSAMSGPDDEGQELRGQVLEAVVGCLWTLARGADGNVPITPTHIPALIGSYQSATRESMRVKSIGTLGVIARRQGAIEDNRQIGMFLLTLIQQMTPKGITTADSVVEALNALYDIYADAEFDYDTKVFVEGGFLKTLKGCLPVMRTLVKSIDKRRYADLRSRADEALLNLVEFIKYKESERQVAKRI